MSLRFRGAKAAAWQETLEKPGYQEKATELVDRFMSNMG
jgi:hypothetical protein